MIDLRGWLVVPGSPGLCPVDTDYRALIGAEHQAIAIARVDPHLVIIIAAGGTFHRHKGLATVRRHIRPCVDHVSTIGIGRIEGYGSEIPATPPQTHLAIEQLPFGAFILWGFKGH